MVGILDSKFCVDASTWKASYTPSKVYLGINRILPSTVSVSLKIEFRNQEEEAEFFVFWQETTRNGAKPFYVYTSLYGVRTHYLVQIEGNLDHAKRPLNVTGKFILYTTRTLEENIPPQIQTQTFSVDMDSTNNYLYVQADDFDVLTYAVTVAPSHGTVTDMGGGAYYYTPSKDFAGTDLFVIKVTDELGVTAQAPMHINVINWKLNEEFKLVMDDNGHLYIDYVNPATLDPLIIQAVDELSMGTINPQGEYVIDVASTQHIDSITKTANDEWLITPK